MVRASADKWHERRDGGVRHRAAGAHFGDVAAHMSHESAPSSSLPQINIDTGMAGGADSAKGAPVS